MDFQLEPCTVFVTSIPYSATSEELCRCFEKFGTIKIVKIVKEHYRGTEVSKGIGFVEFESEESCKAAAAGNDPIQIKGRTLRVQIARKRPERKNDAVFIVGIPEGTTSENLKQVFARYNAIDAKIVRTNGPNQRGFGFVKFPSTENQRQAVQENKQLEIGGQPSRVLYARFDYDAMPVRRSRRFNGRGRRFPRRYSRRYNNENY